MTLQERGLKASLDKLKAEQQEKTWLDAYRVVFERANRIVTGADISLVLADPSSGYNANPTLAKAPGWTDGNTIYLNRKLMAKRLKSGETGQLVLSIKGVNYHEVAHCLFTPRATSNISKRVKKEDMHKRGTWMAFNILEDQRAETLFAASFSTAVVYFSNAVAEWILDRPGEAHRMWPLLTGRKFLPPYLRRDLRKAYVQVHGQIVDVDRVDQIVAEYQLLTFPKDQDKGFDLICEFRDLIDINVPHDLTSGGHTDTNSINRGSPIDPNNQEAARANLEAALEEWESEEENVDEEVDPGESSGKSDGGKEGQGDGGADSKPADDGDSDADEGQGSSPGATTSADEGAMGSPNEDNPDFDIEDLIREQAKDLADEVATSDEVTDDIESITEAVKAEAAGDGDPSGTKPRTTSMPATEADWNLQRRMVKHLRAITHDLEPKWDRGHPAGRLNIQRAMNAPFGDLDIFDIWDEGREDVAETEMVVLLDQSVSMRGEPITKASRVLWALKGALHKVGIRTSVFGFSDGWTLLYHPNERVGPECSRFKTYGGTNPTWAMREGLRVLRQSSAANKLMVVITDGDWFDNHEYFSTVKALHKLDTIMALVRISWHSGGMISSGKGFHVVYDVRRLEDAALAIEALAGEVMAGVGRF